MTKTELECAWIDGPKAMILAFRELSGDASPAWLDVLGASMDDFESALLAYIESAAAS